MTCVRQKFGVIILCVGLRRNAYPSQGSDPHIANLGPHPHPQLGTVLELCHANCSYEVISIKAWHKSVESIPPGMLLLSGRPDEFVFESGCSSMFGT